MTDAAGPEHVEDYLWSDVLRLALSAGAGRIKHTEILAAGCRGALIIDAVERGVISEDGGELHFDSTVTGPDLLPALVSEFEDHPHWTLAQLLQRGHPHLSAFVAELVRCGLWRRHGLALNAAHAEYRDRDAERYERLRTELAGSAATAHIVSSPHSAALTAVAGVLNLQAGSHRTLQTPDDHVIEACGPLTWIVEAVTDYLIAAQQTDLAAGQIDGLANSSQIATS